MIEADQEHNTEVEICTESQLYVRYARFHNSAVAIDMKANARSLPTPYNNIIKPQPWGLRV